MNFYQVRLFSIFLRHTHYLNCVNYQQAFCGYFRIFWYINKHIFHETSNRNFDCSREYYSIILRTHISNVCKKMWWHCLIQNFVWVELERLQNDVFVLSRTLLTVEVKDFEALYLIYLISHLSNIFISFSLCRDQTKSKNQADPTVITQKT